MATPLVIDVNASLKCELDGQALAVRVEQGVIVINVKTAKTARAVIGQVHRFGNIRSNVARLNAALMKASHRLEIHVDDVMVASMGRGTDSGLLRLVGLRRFRIWPLRLI